MWAVSGFAFVGAPPDPVAGRLVFVKVAVIVVVTDDSDSIVSEQTDARCDQSFVSLAAIGGYYFIQFVPRFTLILTIQDREDLCGLSPVGFGVGIDEEETTGCKADDIGIFCESVGTSPGVEYFVGYRSRMDVHREPLILYSRVVD